MPIIIKFTSKACFKKNVLYKAQRKQTETAQNRYSESCSKQGSVTFANAAVVIKQSKPSMTNQPKIEDTAFSAVVIMRYEK